MVVTVPLLIKVVAVIYLILWCICGYRIHKQQKYIMWWMRNSIWATILESMFMAFLAVLVITVVIAIILVIFYL